MTYYTGIEVSLRSVSICVVDDKGEICLEAKVRDCSAQVTSSQRLGAALP